MYSWLSSLPSLQSTVQGLLPKLNNEICTLNVGIYLCEANSLLRCSAKDQTAEQGIGVVAAAYCSHAVVAAAPFTITISSLFPTAQACQ